MGLKDEMKPAWQAGAISGSISPAALCGAVAD